MSDGRGYALKFVNQSADEIIAEVQRKYSVIIERLQAYDHIVHCHEKLQQSVSSVEKKVDAVSEKMEVQNDVHCQVSAVVNQHIRELHDRLKDVQSFLLSPIRELQEHEKALEPKLAYIHSRINEVDSTSNKNESLIQELIDKSKNHRNNELQLHKSIDDTNKKLNKHETIHEGINNRLSLHEDRLSSMLGGFHEKFLSLVYLDTKFEDFKREVESKILRLNVSVREEVQKLSLSLEGRHKENVAFLGETKAECKKTIDENFLDITNSKVKFDNINKQLTILEKKLENINLLLKKYELDK